MDVATGLQYNHHRWYDPFTGRWINEDPIGFAGGDVVLSRYVGNDPEAETDPTGLSIWKQLGKMLGYKWTKETCERAGVRLATELLEALGKHRPDSAEAQAIIRQLKQMGWIEEALGKGTKAGKTIDEGGGLILREVDEQGTLTGRMLEWYPGEGPHHKDPHWKFSSGESGTIRSAGAFAVGVVPGGQALCEGRYGDVVGEAIIESNPFSPLTDWFSFLFDWAQRDIEEAKKHKMKF